MGSKSQIPITSLLIFFNGICKDCSNFPQEWRRKVRYALERDEVLDLFRETVGQLAAERMEREWKVWTNTTKKSELNCK
jgi:hypothetical protein